MTEPAESTAEPAHMPERTTHYHGGEGPGRLAQVAAVVMIVAGVVFVVAVVFFTGFFLGGNGGSYGGPDGWHNTGQMGPGGKPGTCPMMSGGGMMGPGQMGPGEMMGPSPLPPTPVPGTPRP